MDNRKIEQNAVNAVKQAFGDVACVYAYIDENDKTECTDGHLQVYSSSSFTIETVEGQLPVQVKGTTSKRKSDRPKQQVRVSDLKHYLNIAGGCIYFYVYCGSEARSAEVFYRLLLPYDLKKILADIPEQQERISLRFDRLPSDAAELTRLVRRAVKDRTKQRVVAGIAPKTIEEFKDAGLCFDECEFGIELLEGESPANLAPYRNGLYIYDLANRLERAIWQLGGVQKLPNARPKSVPRRSAPWGSLYALSLRILDGYGVSYSVPVRDMECPSFIVKSAKAWEELLRASLVLGYRGSRIFYQRESYFASRDAGAIYVKPDYYIELKDGTVFLADAKYKFVNSIGNADAYEGFAFLEATKTTKLVLIYPALEIDSRGFEVFQHIARNDKDIFGVKVNPRQFIGTSVQGFCTAFAEYISSLSRA